MAGPTTVISWPISSWVSPSSGSPSLSPPSLAPSSSDTGSPISGSPLFRALLVRTAAISPTESSRTCRSCRVLLGSGVISLSRWRTVPRSIWEVSLSLERLQLTVFPWLERVLKLLTPSKEMKPLHPSPKDSDLLVLMPTRRRGGCDLMFLDLGLELVGCCLNWVPEEGMLLCIWFEFCNFGFNELSFVGSVYINHLGVL